MLKAFHAACLTILSIGTMHAACAEDSRSWTNGVPWKYAFPEKEKIGNIPNDLDPEFGAAAVAETNLNDPKYLMEDWNRLPDDLHKWDCGKDSLGGPRRCLDATFKGTGKYAGKAVIVHFESIAQVWRIARFEIVKD
jgi:hypothetical protein